jgi:hypothetical protein
VRDEVFLVADRVDELIRHARPQQARGRRLRRCFGHCAAEAAVAPVLFDSHYERGRSRRGQQCLRVERPQRVQVQHGSLDALSGKDIRCGEAGKHRVRTAAREHHVAALPQRLCLPDDRGRGCGQRR